MVPYGTDPGTRTLPARVTARRRTNAGGGRRLLPRRGWRRLFDLAPSLGGLLPPCAVVRAVESGQFGICGCAPRFLGWREYREALGEGGHPLLERVVVSFAASRAGLYSCC